MNTRQLSTTASQSLQKRDVQEWTGTYNQRRQKNQTNVYAEKDHLIPGHEPPMSIYVEPEHPRQTEGKPTGKQRAL